MTEKKILIEAYTNRTLFFTMPAEVAKIIMDIFHLQLQLNQHPTIQNVINQLPFELSTQIYCRRVDRPPTDAESNQANVAMEHSLSEPL